MPQVLIENSIDNNLVHQNEKKRYSETFDIEKVSSI